MENRIRQFVVAGVKSAEMWRAAGAVALAILGGTACSDSTAPVRAVQIVPASSSVTLQTTPDGQVLNTSVTITNASPQPVTYSSCLVSLEKMGLPALPPGHSDWEFVWGQTCYVLDVQTELSTMPIPNPAFGEIILKPGASATIPIYAIVGAQPYPNFTGAPGAYRVRIPLGVEFLGKFYPAPAEESVSEPFTIVPAA